MIYVAAIQAVCIVALALAAIHEQRRLTAAFQAERLALLEIRIAHPQTQFVKPSPNQQPAPPTDLRALNQVGTILRPVPDKEA